MIISRKEAIEKGLKTYFTGKPCKHGHMSERRVYNRKCLECVKEYNKEYYHKNREYFKDYREKNEEYYKGYSKEHYHENKEYYKEYREKNEEYYREYKKEHRERNREHYNERSRNRYATDDNFKTLALCRNMLQRTLKATNSSKDTRTEEMLGYCNEQLKESIESKFLAGMSWDNYGDWHIDHIYPVIRYIKDGVEDPAIINALDNLIPMWAEHNMEKGDRTLEEYLDDRKDLVELYGVFKKKKR